MTDQEIALTKVRRAIETIRAGKMVIMVDEEDRENEGDLVMAAELCGPDEVNFMARDARGLICLTLEPEMVDRLSLPMMGDSTKKEPEQGTAFTVSIEARTGVTTGISAADRARTIQVAVANDSKPEDIVVPGHVFPLRARSGGVLVRAGHTEGSVDLAKMAGLKGAGVICEIMNDDGSMARMPDLIEFSKKHDIPIVAIADMITYRLLSETFVEETRTTDIRTPYGTFPAVVFKSLVDGSRHVAICKGSDFEEELVDVRVHNQRPLVDSLGDAESGGRYRMDYGLRMLSEVDRGVLVYLTHSNPLDRLDEELDILSVREPLSPPAIPADRIYFERMVGTGARILRALGVKKMRIHSTNKRAFVGLSGYGLEVVESQMMKY